MLVSVSLLLTGRSAFHSCSRQRLWEQPARKAWAFPAESVCGVRVDYCTCLAVLPAKLASCQEPLTSLRYEGESLIDWLLVRMVIIVVFTSVAVANAPVVPYC